MPDLPQELHGRRRQRVVLGEAQLGREDAALERRALGALDQRLPVQQVVLRHGTRRDALGRVVSQRPVFLQQPAVGGGLGHFGGGRERGGLGLWFVVEGGGMGYPCCWRARAFGGELESFWCAVSLGSLMME